MRTTKQSLQSNGIVKKGHFQLVSGLHSEYYVQKDLIFRHPLILAGIIEDINEIIDIERYLPNSAVFTAAAVITGPPTVGAYLAAMIASRRCSQFAPPEKDRTTYIVHNMEVVGDRMIFRRGHDKLIKDRRLIVIEDIITTGSSVLKVAKSAHACGATIDSIICLWKRNKRALPGILEKVPIYSLIDTIIRDYEPSECPLCAKGIPIMDPKKAG